MIQIYQHLHSSRDANRFHENISGYEEIPWGSFLTFPGGEIHCKINNLPADCHILARIRSWQDMGELLTITNAIKNYHRVLHQPTSIHLFLPYVPGARQDRIANLGEPFTLKMYADLINAQEYDSVTIVDPHSYCTEIVINNIKILDISSTIKEIVLKNNYDTIIISDIGGAKKIDYYLPDKLDLNLIQCLKKRDTKTGKLSDFRIVDNIPDGANAIVLDDIIDGAGTFIGLGNEIRKHYNINKLGLYGTHGIFSKGTDIIYKVFDEIYTTNSFYTEKEYNTKNIVLTQVYNILTPFSF